MKTNSPNIEKQFTFSTPSHKAPNQTIGAYVSDPAKSEHNNVVQENMGFAYSQIKPIGGPTQLSSGALRKQGFVLGSFYGPSSKERVLLGTAKRGFGLEIEASRDDCIAANRLLHKGCIVLSSLFLSL